MCLGERRERRKEQGGRRKEGGRIKVAQAGEQLENKYKAFERMV